MSIILNVYFQFDIERLGIISVQDTYNWYPKENDTVTLSHNFRHMEKFRPFPLNMSSALLNHGKSGVNPLPAVVSTSTTMLGLSCHVTSIFINENLT